jgi:hypothetical protein
MEAVAFTSLVTHRRAPAQDDSRDGVVAALSTRVRLRPQRAVRSHGWALFLRRDFWEAHPRRDALDCVPVAETALAAFTSRGP